MALLLKKKKTSEIIWTWERLNSGASRVTNTGWDRQMHRAITPCVDVCGLPALRLFLLLGNDKSPTAYHLSKSINKTPAEP